MVLIASVMTAFLSNNAVAVLLTPVVIQTAASMGFSARPFIIAVAIGASECFAAPIGYQTNTLVYGAGGYRFNDYIKVGLPLNLLFCALVASTYSLQPNGPVGRPTVRLCEFSQGAWQLSSSMSAPWRAQQRFTLKGGLQIACDL